MVAGRVLHRSSFRLLRTNTDTAGLRGTLTVLISQHQYFSNTDVAADGENSKEESDSKWLVLLPFTPLAGGSEIRKLISRRTSDGREKYSAASPSTTALKWILKCCPHLPRSLVQKLFGLRQVRRESSNAKIENTAAKKGAKEFMGVGDRIFLPKSIDGKHPSRIKEKPSSHYKEI